MHKERFSHNILVLSKPDKVRGYYRTQGCRTPACPTYKPTHALLMQKKLPSTLSAYNSVLCRSPCGTVVSEEEDEDGPPAAVGYMLMMLHFQNCRLLPIAWHAQATEHSLEEPATTLLSTWGTRARSGQQSSYWKFALLQIHRMTLVKCLMTALCQSTFLKTAADELGMVICLSTYLSSSMNHKTLTYRF